MQIHFLGDVLVAHDLIIVAFQGYSGFQVTGMIEWG